MNEDEILILKARQLGMSWLVCGYGLWKCLSWEGRVGLFFSQGQLEADELLRRVTVMYERLPDWLRGMYPPLDRGLTKFIGWNNGSYMRSLPCTKKAGRSLTASFVVLDENAHMEYAAMLEAAVVPTIDNGGQIIKISTANGIGNSFHSDWVKAEKGESDYKPLFLSWRNRPDRNDEWYERKRRNAKDPALFLQEYPSSPDEAFISSGTPRFLYDWLRPQVENLCDPAINTDTNPESLPPVFAFTSLAGIPGLSIYELPHPNKRYCIGADPSEGLPKGDYSPATVVNMDTWEEVAVLDGKFDPTLFAIYLAQLGEFYNDAALIAGRNNHGHATLAKLVELGYNNIVKHWKDERLGWPENVQTKVQMVDDMAAALKDNVLKIRHRPTLTQLQMYQKLDNGKTGAPPGEHDDLCTTWFFIAAYLSLPRQESNAPAVDTQRRLPALTGASAGVGVRQERLNIGRRSNFPTRGGIFGGRGIFTR